MSDETNTDTDEYIRAKRHPIQEKAEQKVVSALLKAGVREGDMDPVLDAVDELVSAELWVMGYMIRRELVDMEVRARKEEIPWDVMNFRLRQVVMLLGLRSERPRHVTLGEARMYLRLRQSGCSYRQIAYIVGRSTETVHRGVQTAEEYEAKMGDVWDGDGEEGEEAV